ncbi:hypothetical protein VTK56DRAFT_7838 [Thermocarpiscus australiensis]
MADLLETHGHPPSPRGPPTIRLVAYDPHAQLEMRDDRSRRTDAGQAARATPGGVTVVQARGAKGGGDGSVGQAQASQPGDIHPLRMNPTGFLSWNEIEEPAARKVSESELEAEAISSSKIQSKIPRLERRDSVFKKVWNALAIRLLPAGRTKHAQERRAQNLRKTIRHTTSAIGPVPEFAASTSESELHLNDSMNVRKDKRVTWLDGTTQCQPRQGFANSLPGRSRVEDPFSDILYAARQPTEFENRLRPNPRATSASKLPDTNPFRSQRPMESSSDSRLPSLPTASNRPGASHDPFRTTARSPALPSRFSIYESKEYNILPGFENIVPLIRIGDEEAPTGRSAETFDDEHGPASSHDQGLDTVTSYIPVVDDVDRKRHPSPCMPDLELLKSEFQRRFPELCAAPAVANGEKVEARQPPHRAVMAPDAAASVAQKSQADANSSAHDDTDKESSLEDDGHHSESHGPLLQNNRVEHSHVGHSGIIGSQTGLVWLMASSLLEHDESEMASSTEDDRAFL